MNKPRSDCAPDDDNKNSDRPDADPRMFQRSLLRRDVFSVFDEPRFCDELPPTDPPFTAWRASHTPMACAHSPGMRRASQPIKVSPAVRVLSGSFGSRSKTEMSLINRARSVSLATPKSLRKKLQGPHTESG